MNYEGWAFKPDEKEQAKQIRERYAIIADILKGKINLEKRPAYGHTNFTATVDESALNEITEMDVLIYADSGNLCFGGTCTKSTGNTFAGRYFID